MILWIGRKFNNRIFKTTIFRIIMGRKKVIRKPEKHILIVLWDFSLEIHWEMNLSHQWITV